MAERITLITGASAGIGAELARVFAANGHRIALVARREDRLRALAAELERDGSEPLVIPCDLESPAAGEDIARTLEARGVEPDHVVNSAGFGLLGAARGLSLSGQLGMIDVNIRMLTDLSLRFAEPLARHRGGILNVASIAGFAPGPNMAVYYASKAYVISLTEALHHEMRRHGVRVTALCPGPVPTEFQARAGFTLAGGMAMLRQSPRAVAEAGYRGLMAGRRVVVPGLLSSLAATAMRHLPRGLLLAAIGSAQARRGR